ncbi:MAG: alginate export family protein [Candidatus Hydrogenedentes bacterium]|nr:alginate export family protein [Candidatus Hydrogenedentota bacterium]
MRTIVCCVLLALTATTVYAELQNMQVGGELRIRARYWDNVYSNGINGPAQLRIPAGFLPARPTGGPVVSRYDWDDRGNDLKFVEHRTRLNVRADYTNDVSAFIELESYDLWGEDFRSNYVTGADARAATGNDVEVYQAYIESREMWGYPLRLRIGRQEMKMGKGWLVDDITTALIGQSHDAVRLTYDTNAFSVDAWWSKLAENSPLEEDGDVDFYGIYATYKALEPVDISLYWMYLRDARSLNDTNFVWPIEWVEDLLGLDDYDPTNLHTVGLRAFGQYEAWDYDLEVAYQTGDADQVGFRFKPFGYGDDDAEYDSWAGDLEVGYTFDMQWSPRVFIGGAYFEGEDNRDLSFWDWLNPFDRSDASVSFNRLFPGKPYSAILEIGQDMSNFYQIRGGVEAHPTETVTAGLTVAYYGINEPFDWPPYVTLGRFRIPIAPALSFWTKEADNEIGFVTHLYAKYNYSEDLYFKLGWEHLFTGDGLAEGSFTHRYGLEFSGGTDDENANYFYCETGLKF